MAERILSPEKFTYSATTGFFTPAASPTDIALITGAADKKITIVEVMLSGVQTTAGHPTVDLIKRSADNTGGTSATNTVVPHNARFPASTAVVREYTANPAGLGAAVGTVCTRKAFIPAPATAANAEPTRWDFRYMFGTGIVLNSAAEVLAVNLAATTLTGGSVSVTFTWIEEPLKPNGT